MDKHYGSVVENVVRKSGQSITDLAAGMNLNRRTLYNYFQNKYLKSEVIHTIGMILNHDFSREFPELFTSEQFAPTNAGSVNTPNIKQDDWKDKYIKLLEVYNDMLICQLSEKDSN